MIPFSLSLLHLIRLNQWSTSENIQAWAELSQAQVNLKVIVEVVLEDGVEVGVEVEV